MVMRNLILQMLETNLHLQHCARQHCETGPHWLWTTNHLETTSMRPTEPAQIVYLLMKFLKDLESQHQNLSSQPMELSVWKIPPYKTTSLRRCFFSTQSALCLFSKHENSWDRTVWFLWHLSSYLSVYKQNWILDTTLESFKFIHGTRI